VTTKPHADLFTEDGRVTGIVARLRLFSRQPTIHAPDPAAYRC
jgi:hypothetical protein